MAAPPAPDASPAGRIVVADDEPANLELFERLLGREGHVVIRARDGAEALERITTDLPDLALLDVVMPVKSGLDVCRAVKNDRATRLIPVVLITALNDATDRLRGIDAGADDFLSKPVNTPELRARVRSLLRIKRYTDELDSADATLLSLARTIEARDAYTDGHCRRLSTYATALGRAIGLPDEDLTALARGGVLHDIGKVGVPDAILLKSGPLNTAEFATMKEHTVIGDALCATLQSLKRVRPIVRHHHERLDGTGYPDGLRGDDIPLLAQIMGVVDVFDALTTARPYKTAASNDHACRELRREVELGWRRKDLVDAFVTLVRERRHDVA